MLQVTFEPAIFMCNYNKAQFLYANNEMLRLSLTMP